MEFTGFENCGNSPKNTLLAEWERALALGDEAAMRAVLTADVALENGARTTTGIEEVMAELARLRGDLTHAHLDMAVTHGREGAAGGSWTRGSATSHVAHLFRFASAKGTALNWIRVVHG
ncbi:nuclear transport factor 2 family protein [Microbacterium karelineae]|uniref:nuclear transport factor 2 family protein n=1 Tax=Microbacterium karelineae TaxID=2654283 RepID=UPI0012EA41F5|nr:nuclear transport factor 2 family protein [Microbacterium karelineae]